MGLEEHSTTASQPMSAPGYTVAAVYPIAEATVFTPEGADATESNGSSPKDTANAVGGCALLLYGILFLIYVTGLSIFVGMSGLWTAIVTIPLVVFLAGPWLLANRDEASVARIALVITAAIVASLACIALQYVSLWGLIAVLEILEKLSWSSQMEDYVGSAMLSVYLAVFFSISGVLLKVIITATSTVYFKRFENPSGFIVIAAVASTAYMTFQSYEELYFLQLLPGLLQLTIVLYRTLCGIMIDCFTGIMFGASMSLSSLHQGPNDNSADWSLRSLGKALVLPLVFHLTYDTGMFYAVSVALLKGNAEWLKILVIPGIVTVLAGIVATVMWFRVVHVRLNLPSGNGQTMQEIDMEIFSETVV